MLASLGLPAALDGRALAPLQARCRRHECATLKVPLDRTGALPGVRPAQARAAQLRRRAPDARLPLRRAGRRGHRGDARRHAARAGPHRPLPRRGLRPARHRRLRAAALPEARARRPAAQPLCRRRLRAAPGRGADEVHDAGLRRGPRGDPRRAWRGAADAVRDLLRHRAGARLRARPSRPRRPDDPRLGRGPRRPRPVRAGRLPRHGPALAGLCPGRCRGVSRDPLADVATLAARLRTRDLRGRAYDRRGKGHRRSAADRDRRPPLRLRLQPAAARRDAGRGPRRAGRRRRAAGAAQRRGRRPRRPPVAEVVLQRPLRDRVRGDAAAVGRRDAVRGPARGGHAARRRAGAGGVRAVRPAYRGGGRDRALPRLAGRAVGPRRRRPRRRIPPFRR